MDEVLLSLKKRIEELENENATLRNEVSKLERLKTLALMGLTSSSWRHSIEGDAFTIRYNAEFLEEKLKSGNDSGVQKYIDSIILGTKKILESPISPTENLQVINIDLNLQERIGWRKKFESLSDVKFTFHAIPNEEVLLVRANPQWINKGFDILIDNAVQAMIECEKKEIEIFYSTNEYLVNVYLQDSGVGIPKEIKKDLFHKRIKKDTSTGLGVGLLIAQTIFDLYGGELVLENSTSNGTTFCIRLPRSFSENA